MPSSMTHSYFCLDVYQQINEKKIKDYKYLKTFAQGPDILYFLSNLNKKTINIRKLGHRAHQQNTQEFFNNLINYIVKNNLTENEQVISFLYGYISHYILDSTLHPYIYYKTGIFKKNDKKTYKYNGLHQEMEYYIDIYMIFQNEKKEAKNFKPHKYFENFKINSDLKNIINTVFKETYNIDNVFPYYNKGIKGLKTIFKYIRYDRIGLKKYLYKMLDYISASNSQRKEPQSYHVLHNQKIHYLNNDKRIWNHPMYLEETYDLSYIELYRISIDKAVNIINEVNKIIKEKKINSKEIKYLFKDISYLTGKDCSNKEKMQYFEF